MKPSATKKDGIIIRRSERGEGRNAVATKAMPPNIVAVAIFLFLETICYAQTRGYYLTVDKLKASITNVKLLRLIYRHIE
jgi:hypothetical protein